MIAWLVDTRFSPFVFPILQSRQHVCQSCGLAFKVGVALKRHQAVAHPTQPNKYRCKSCDKTFPMEYYLKVRVNSCGQQ